MSIDQFGIKKLHETIPGGGEFYLPNIDISPIEAIGDIQVDGRPTGMGVYGDGSINPNGIWWAMNGDYPRLYVFRRLGGVRPFLWEQIFWHDVEMTCYYHRSTTESNQLGISMGAISWHHMEHQHPEVYTYYLKHHFDSGVFSLQKEWKHGVPGQDYKVFESPPINQFENNKWFGFKFVVRNIGLNLGEWVRRNGFDGSRGIRSIMSDLSVSNISELVESRLTGNHPTGGFVYLEGYLDETDGKDGGDWKKVIELTDDHDWGFGVPWNYGPLCFVRSDKVKDFLFNRFSIRSIKKSWWIQRVA